MKTGSLSINSDRLLANQGTAYLDLQNADTISEIPVGQVNESVGALAFDTRTPGSSDAPLRLDLPVTNRMYN